MKFHKCSIESNKWSAKSTLKRGINNRIHRIRKSQISSNPTEEQNDPQHAFSTQSSNKHYLSTFNYQIEQKKKIKNKIQKHENTETKKLEQRERGGLLGSSVVNVDGDG